MTIQLVVALRIAGAVQAAGTQVTLSEALEADLIYQGKATRVGAGPDQGGLGVPVFAQTNLQNGVWNNCPSIFRLEMTGTGTVTIDSKDSLGNITLNVYTVTLTSATNEIGFPYAGDAAVSIRATLTGTATAKVI